jgi:hypothetical protein
LELIIDRTIATLQTEARWLEKVREKLDSFGTEEGRRKG